MFILYLSQDLLSKNYLSITDAIGELSYLGELY